MTITVKDEVIDSAVESIKPAFNRSLLSISETSSDLQCDYYLSLGRRCVVASGGNSLRCCNKGKHVLGASFNAVEHAEGDLVKMVPDQHLHPMCRRARRRREQRPSLDIERNLNPCEKAATWATTS